MWNDLQIGDTVVLKDIEEISKIMDIRLPGYHDKQKYLDNISLYSNRRMTVQDFKLFSYIDPYTGEHSYHLAVKLENGPDKYSILDGFLNILSHNEPNNEIPIMFGGMTYEQKESI